MKKFSAILLALLLALTLAACGGGTSSEPADTGDAGTSQPADEPADSGDDTADTGGDLGAIEDGASLVYWTMWNEAEPQGMVVQEAADAFTAETGVAIEINFNGRDIRKTLEPALAGGEMIDLFDEDIERVLNAWGDYLLPLDDYVAASYDDTDGQPYRDVVNNTLITLAEDLGTAKGFADGGKVHNVPYQPSTFVVMYNKDLFEAADIGATPTTWDEFLDVCAKLKDNGTTAITVDDAYMAALFGYTMDRIVGADKCYEMVTSRDFSDPGVLKAAELWKEMIDQGYLSQKAATNVYPEGQVSEIATGDVAMYLNGTWLPNEIKGDAPDLNWGAFAWPSIESTGDGPEANNFGAQSFGIHKDTQYPNAAFAFVRWMTVGEWDQRLADESMGVPMANDATWPTQLADAKAVIDTTTKRLNWAVGMEDDPEINTALKDNFARLVTGDLDAQGFADAMASLSGGAAGGDDAAGDSSAAE